MRVSNELGAAQPRAAKFSAIVVGVTSSLLGFFIVNVLLLTAKDYPSLFSTDTEVKEIVYQLTPLLGLAVLVYNIQLSLAGMYINCSNDSALHYFYSFSFFGLLLF